MILLALLVLVTILVFYFVLQSDLSGIQKFFVILVEMIIVSQILIRRYKLPSELGLILLKSQRGIDIIENLAKNQGIWNFFADVSSTISYGLFSVVLMRKNTSWKSVIVGLVFLVAISSIVAPLAMEFLKTVLVGDTMLEKGGSTSQINAESIAFIMLAMILLGGFFAGLLFAIVYYGLFILSHAIQFIFYGVDTISQTDPGGTLLLPGVNLPLFEGIFALIIIMVVHETSHAVLAKIAKVPIKSSGIVLFGIIPIGAFVEPDDKKLEKIDAVRQTRVLAAGSGANFVSSVALLIIFVIFTFALNGGYAGTEGLIYSAVKFIYITIGLAFTLNFIVATVNLLPLPLFDGYKIIDINVSNKHMVKALMIITLVAFLLNFLPWLFK